MKQYNITAAIIFSCHNSFLFNDAFLLKVVAFNVTLFDVAQLNLKLFDAALIDVELF